MTAPNVLNPNVGFGLKPDAFTGYRELVPYAGQTIIVVGCGRTHNPHRINNWNLAAHTHRDIHGVNAFTFDINAAMNPDRVGDFWVEDHTEDLPIGAFGLVFLENLPAGVFNSAGQCLVVARTAHRLLQNGGVLVVRTGHGLIAAGTPVHAALVQVFGAANVIVALDQHNWATDLRARK